MPGRSARAFVMLAGMDMHKVQHSIAQALLLEPLNEALGLAHRFQEAKGFRGYLQERKVLLIPIVVLMVMTSLSCAAASVLYLGGTRSILVLMAILLVPFVLAGSLFVQAYVFFAWLENRAIAKALRRSLPRGPVARWLKQRLGVDMGTFPPVPWVLAAAFLVAPLAALLDVAPAWALVLIAFMVLAPVAFARLDR
jgi:hypothetical protein